MEEITELGEIIIKDTKKSKAGDTNIQNDVKTGSEQTDALLSTISTSKGTATIPPPMSLAEQLQIQRASTTADNGLIRSLFDDSSMLDLLQDSASRRKSAVSASNALSSLQTNFLLRDQAAVSSFVQSRQSGSSGSAEDSSAQESDTDGHLLAKALGLKPLRTGGTRNDRFELDEDSKDLSSATGTRVSQFGLSPPDRNAQDRLSEFVAEDSSVQESDIDGHLLAKALGLKPLRTGGTRNDRFELDEDSKVRSSATGTRVSQFGLSPPDRNAQDRLSEFVEGLSPAELDAMLATDDLTNFINLDIFPGAQGIPVDTFEGPPTPLEDTMFNSDSLFDIEDMLSDFGITVPQQDELSLIQNANQFGSEMQTSSSIPVSSSKSTATQSNGRGAMSQIQAGRVPSGFQQSSTFVSSNRDSVRQDTSRSSSQEPINGRSLGRQFGSTDIPSSAGSLSSLGQNGQALPSSSPTLSDIISFIFNDESATQGKGNGAFGSNANAMEQTASEFQSTLQGRGTNTFGSRSQEKGQGAFISTSQRKGTSEFQSASSRDRSSISGSKVQGTAALKSNGQNGGAFVARSLGQRTGAFESAALGQGTSAFESASLGDGNSAFESASLGDGTGAFGSASLGDGTGAFGSASLGAGTGAFGSASLGDGTDAFGSASVGQGAGAIELQGNSLWQAISRRGHDLSIDRDITNVLTYLENRNSFINGKGQDTSLLSTLGKSDAQTSLSALVSRNNANIDSFIDSLLETGNNLDLISELFEDQDTNDDNTLMFRSNSEQDSNDSSDENDDDSAEQNSSETKLDTQNSSESKDDDSGEDNDDDSGEGNDDNSTGNESSENNSSQQNSDDSTENSSRQDDSDGEDSNETDSFNFSSSQLDFSDLDLDYLDDGDIDELFKLLDV
ncbi:dentin sialophosphoprotein-like [Pecten maximus]|uniref:dentin sialophosphoprotein-like n=1 Tax=Pecten maximus TaxID=6579 RepID=UPI001458A4B7|nr:dentin sialophosphoprotein-like [Pecten maximus]